ncbi:MAG: methyltransferase domain-containing protein [Byssovorax sp.]
MRTSLLEILACPACPPEHEAPLTLAIEEEKDGDVIQGELTCARCHTRFPITKGVARFVKEDDDYCRNFGYQWQRWKDLQIDRLGHHDISEERFFANAPWDRKWLEGKLILDAGCGAGRFSDIAAKYGARVVSADLSQAIDACRETTSVHGDRVNHVQASIYDLPFKRGVFDGVFCFGVIQHTPDPRKTMETLPAFLKPGGLLGYDFYEATSSVKLGFIRLALRRVTPDLPVTANLRLAQTLTAALFPVGAVWARIPLARRFVGLLPIAVVHDKRLSLKQEYLWTLLDTFDWYGPKFEIRQKHPEVAHLLKSLGLRDVKSRWGVATARAPEAPRSAASIEEKRA